MVKYRYDAWGKCVIDASTTNTELAALNPFRYRSYYYDTETNLYFLKTRYYDPEIGRFMTIDDIFFSVTQRKQIVDMISKNSNLDVTYEWLLSNRK